MAAASTIAEGEVAGGGAGGGYHLLVMGPASFTRHPLPESGEIVIGRSESADIAVGDVKASRRHARLRIERGSRFEIQDLGSANGTRVRDVRLDSRRPVPVLPGEAVAIGSLVLMVQRNRRSAGLAPARPGLLPTAAPLPDAEGPPTRPRFQGAGEAMRGLLALAERAAASSISVVLLGETGVGKEILARLIHGKSARQAGPFVCVNCAALAEPLLESELFGHEKGAFTGADRVKPGLLETAAGGTVFLDEIGEMPAAIQAKVLRAVEHREATRVGSVSPRRLDVRFVAATNRDLEAEVARGRFRADLFFRLAGVCLAIPSLRERRGEIPSLAKDLLAQACRDAGRHPVPALSPAAMDLLLKHDWPGNVRELRNVLEQALLLHDGDTLGPEALRFGSRRDEAAAPREFPAPALADIEPRAEERARIERALASCGGNQTRAARLLGMSRKVLIARLDAFGVIRPRKRSSR